MIGALDVSAITITVASSSGGGDKTPDGGAS